MNKIIALFFITLFFIKNTLSAQQAASINSNEISIIEIAPSGLLWIGLTSGGCVKYDPSNGSTSFFNKTNSTLKTDSIKSIDAKIIGGVLHVMMSTDKGVVFQRAGIWDTVASLPDNRVTDIAILTGNKIVFSTKDSGFAVYDTTFKFIKTIKKENTAGMLTNNIKKMSRRNLSCGTIYAATDKGVIVIDSANNITTITKAGSSILSDSITCVYATRSCNNECVLGSDKGISICSGTACQNYNTGNGMSSNLVSVIERDSAGRIWIGTKDSGLIYYDNINFTKITAADGLPSNNITDIHCLTNSCTCYIGTKDAGVVSVGCDKKVSKKLNLSSIFDLTNGKTIITYPQPANDLIHFELTEQVNNLQFMMFDYAGNKVKSNTLHQIQDFQVDVQDLPQGFYTYIISDQKGLHVSGKSLIVR